MWFISGFGRDRSVDSGLARTVGCVILGACRLLLRYSNSCLSNMALLVALGSERTVNLPSLTSLAKVWVLMPKYSAACCVVSICEGLPGVAKGLT